MLEGGGGGREADGLVPAAILEAAYDQAATECVTGAYTIDDFDLMPRRRVDLTVRRDDRAPPVQQHSGIFPERDRYRCKVEPLAESACELAVRLRGHVSVVVFRLGADVEAHSRVFLCRDEHIHLLHQRLLHGARFLGAPQLASVVQVVAHGETRFLCRCQRLRSDPRCRFAQRRRDPAHVVPARSSEHGFPIDAAGTHSADRRCSTIVKHAARAGRGTKLGEVETSAVVNGPLDVSVNALLARTTGDHSAQRVAGKPRHPSRRDAEPRGNDGNVQLSSADVGVEAVGLLQSLGRRGRKPDHPLAEGDEIHAKSYVRSDSLTSFLPLANFSARGDVPAPFHSAAAAVPDFVVQIDSRTDMAWHYPDLLSDVGLPIDLHVAVLLVQLAHSPLASDEMAERS